MFFSAVIFNADGHVTGLNEMTFDMTGLNLFAR